MAAQRHAKRNSRSWGDAAVRREGGQEEKTRSVVVRRRGRQRGTCSQSSLFSSKHVHTHVHLAALIFGGFLLFAYVPYRVDTGEARMPRLVSPHLFIFAAVLCGQALFCLSLPLHVYCSTHIRFGDIVFVVFIPSSFSSHSEVLVFIYVC